MIKEFEKHLIYVFKRELLAKCPVKTAIGQFAKDLALHSEWSEDIDGCEVKVKSNRTAIVETLENGRPKELLIVPEWCEAYWKYEEA